MSTDGLHVGTSGWSYADWAGAFYPPRLPAAERLSFYAGRFDAVEVNATFYRLPTAAMIAAWNRRLAPSFHLVAKGPRWITHRKKLADCDEPLRIFFDLILQVRCLRAVLWQLPPMLHKDVGRLDAFLGRLPPRKDLRHAVEFRHPSWWDEEVAQVLARHRAAFVAISHPQLPGRAYATTDFFYLRFHGLGERLYDYDYSRGELGAWARRVAPHVGAGGRALYAFFNNDYHAHAPRNAAAFRDLLAQDERSSASSTRR